MMTPRAIVAEPQESSPTAVPDDSIDLLKIVAMFTREWRTGLIVAAVVFVIAALVVLRMPARYEATVVLLPKDSQESASSGLAALFGGVRSSGSTYGSFLTSRALRDDVIRQEDLTQVFHTHSAEAARSTLGGMTRVLPAGDGTITVQVRNRDAATAARIANAYIVALRGLQETMANAQADLQRQFYEAQLQREKEELAAAEQDLVTTEEGSGVVQMDTQTQIGLSAIAEVRSQITSLQVRLAALLQSATEQNPEVKTLRSQIGQLEAQERAMENGAGGAGAGAAAPAGKMPKVNLAYTRKLREVKMHEAMVNSLTNHYEDLRLSAGVLGDNFDVIDHAVVPEQPTWPPRKLFLWLAFGASVIVGWFTMALRIVWRRIASDPVQRLYLHEIAQSVRSR